MSPVTVNPTLTTQEHDRLMAIPTGTTPLGYTRITSATLGVLLAGTVIYAYTVADTAHATPVVEPVTVAANGSWYLDLPNAGSYTLVGRLSGHKTVTMEVTT